MRSPSVWENGYIEGIKARKGITVNYGLKAFGQSKLIWQLSKTTNGPLLASGELYISP
jgi:hypothetical protein